MSILNKLNKIKETHIEEQTDNFPDVLWGVKAPTLSFDGNTNIWTLTYYENGNYIEQNVYDSYYEAKGRVDEINRMNNEKALIELKEALRNKTKIKPLLSPEELKKVFNIDEKTGVITKQDKVYSSDSYVRLSHEGNLYLAHRVIWESVNGKIPNGLYIDHINGIKNDNRIENLRLVTAAENSQNRNSVNSNNNSGSKIPGVSYCKTHKKFRVTLILNKKQYFYGYYSNLKDAEKVAKIARRSLFDFNNI